MFKLRSTPLCGYDSSLMRDYNTITIHLLFVDVRIGRPIVTGLNRLIRWYKQTRFNQICRYCVARVQQVNLDLLQGGIVGDTIRKDYAIQLEIKECERYVPARLYVLIDKLVERYYEYKLLKNHRKEDYYEDIE